MQVKGIISLSEVSLAPTGCDLMILLFINSAAAGSFMEVCVVRV